MDKEKSLVSEDIQTEKEKKKDIIIFQSNSLVEAVLEQPLKQLELKLMYIISRHINNKDYLDENAVIQGIPDDYLKITIAKEKMCEYLKIDPASFYHQMDYLSTDIMKKQITFKNGSEYVKVTLFPSFEYRKGYVVFHLNSILRSHLQNFKQIKGQFTKFSLRHVVNMSSSYAIRMYPLLKQYQGYKDSKNVWSRTFELEQLKELLGISVTEKYKNFKDLKSRVLLTVQQQISNLTDLKVTFSVQKNGRFIDKVIFKIELQETQIEQAEEMFEKDMKFISKQGLPEMQALHKNVVEKYNSNSDLRDKILKAWISSQVVSFTAASKEKIKLSSSKKVCKYPPLPSWYISFLEVQKSF